jgi:hypothetical protein
MTVIINRIYALGHVIVSVFLLTVVWGSFAHAQVSFRRIPTQFIVALGDPAASSGTGAETWGLWHQDPGPRGCLLDNYKQLKATGTAPAQWKYDSKDWWLEEHGIIMEKPQFPLPAGQYVVTGGREVTAVLTVFPKDVQGVVRWQLGGGAKLYDVTHLPCHAARYRPQPGTASCSPDTVNRSNFPVAPGVPMPSVRGCNKQDYAVLFVIGVAEGQ